MKQVFIAVFRGLVEGLRKFRCPVIPSGVMVRMLTAHHRPSPLISDVNLPGFCRSSLVAWMGPFRQSLAIPREPVCRPRPLAAETRPKENASPSGWISVGSLADAPRTEASGRHSVPIAGIELAVSPTRGFRCKIVNVFPFLTSWPPFRVETLTLYRTRFCGAGMTMDHLSSMKQRLIFVSSGNLSLPFAI
jgi:hypothetical protein